MYSPSVTISWCVVGFIVGSFKNKRLEYVIVCIIHNLNDKKTDIINTNNLYSQNQPRP